MQSLSPRPLMELLSPIEQHVTPCSLGTFPTPVESLQELVAAPGVTQNAYIKREDRSSGIYGGNKLRPLEFLLGHAQRLGARRIYTLGAYGSNHAVATQLHAPRVGLQPGALLFGQAPSFTAAQNLRLVAARTEHLVVVPHWSSYPWGRWKLSQEIRAHRQRSYVMAPGGASPLGALGYVSAALELAQQVRLGQLPEPKRIVVAVGSTCTSAGLLVGLRLAQRVGLAFHQGLPELLAVRVSPWPVTSALRIAHLAHRCSRLLNQWAPREYGPVQSRRQLAAHLRVDGRFLGAGYGRISLEGLSAITAFGDFGRRGLDTTYSAKSAAALLWWLRRDPCPTLYWATKSSVPLPALGTQELARIPSVLRPWLAACPDTVELGPG